MRIGLSFLALAALAGVAPGCIIDTTNDDDGAETGSATGNATAGSGSTSTEGGSTAAGSTAAETSEASTAADDTAGTPAACGWGPTGDEAVPEGYVCGGDGEDPSGTYPQRCPDTVDLQVGAACSGIEGPGCCDAQGNAWFCGNDGSGDALARIEC